MKVLFVHQKPPEATVERTVLDCVASFGKYSQHEIQCVSYSELYCCIDQIHSYDCICLYKFHINNENYLDLKTKIKIKNFKGLKAVFLEEEYFLLHDKIENILFMDIQLIFSALPAEYMRKIYGERLKNQKLIKVYHGYLEDYMFDLEEVPYKDRPIDVSYRALKLPAFYGRLGLEKNLIGEKFSYHAAGMDLELDISNDINKRLWGRDWHQFLQKSKAVLGVEGSSSVVDSGRKIFDAAIEYEKRNPEAPFEKIEKMHFNGLDISDMQRSLSPRNFEYSAFKCLMILYEGAYEGVLIPHRHYVPLKKDFSNIQEVVEILKSPLKAQEIINNAYQEIALNPAYHFRRYVEIFDRALDEYADQKVTVHIPDQLLEVPNSLSETRVEPAAGNIYQFIKKFLDERLDRNSALYRILQYGVKMVKETLELWHVVRQYAENIGATLGWFLILLPQKREFVPVLSALLHLQKREEYLGRPIINIRNTNDYCSIESIYPAYNLISFKELISFLVELKQEYLLFNLASSWHLNDIFRRDFAVKMRPSAYRFMKKMVEYP